MKKLLVIALIVSILGCAPASDYTEPTQVTQVDSTQVTQNKLSSDVAIENTRIMQSETYALHSSFLGNRYASIVEADGVKFLLVIGVDTMVLERIGDVE